MPSYRLFAFTTATLIAASAGMSLHAGAQDSTHAATPSPTALTFVDLTPQQGKLTDVLKVQVTKATALGRTPFVELGATWCGPCRHIKENLGDKRMIDAFARTYIVRLDIDEWKGQLDAFGFKTEGIPAFFAIDSTGKATGPTINGGAWGEDTPENMAPPLKKFFSENLRKS